MYATFNMGTGFCVVVSPADARAAVAALTSAGEQPVVAGSVTGRPGRYVSIPAAGLLGRGDVFEAGRGTLSAWTALALSRRTRASSPVPCTRGWRSPPPPPPRH